MKRILIKAVGFIGDNLFASSIGRKLYDHSVLVDLLLSVNQPYELLSYDPHLFDVHLEVDESKYDEVFQLQPINRKETPIKQFQIQCGIKDPDSFYKIYTNQYLDEYIAYQFSNIKSTKKIVTYLSNWEERSFLFTEEEYNRGVDVPNLGYGGKHRDINYIIEELSKRNDVYLIEVGKPAGYDQRSWDPYSVSEFSLTASIINNSDLFIGAEGGLCNLAAGVGTPTIITGDFIHQLYGWNGVIEKNEEPKLGPKYYFGEPHITLNPYLTDKEIVEQINERI